MNAMVASDNVTPRPELTVYEAELPNMLKMHKGQFVVIHGKQVANYFRTRAEALGWAYDAFGLDPFFVKQVSEEENVAHFIRDIGPCLR
jgi:hypothetical protein